MPSPIIQMMFFTLRPEVSVTPTISKFPVAVTFAPSFWVAVTLNLWMPGAA